MSRDLTPDFAAALADRDLRPVIFFEGEFASGTVRLWSGLGEIGWAGQSWSGAGALLGLGAIEETSEVVAGGRRSRCRAFRSIWCKWPSRKPGKVCRGGSGLGF